MTMPTLKAVEAACTRLVGRTIVRVEPNAFLTDNAGSNARNGWTCDPVLVLDDGSRVFFVVDETETGEYGLTVARSKPTAGR